MKCHFCGTRVERRLTVKEIGIAFSLAGEDFSFCAKCLKAMSAYKFWKKLFTEQGYKFPSSIKK